MAYLSAGVYTTEIDNSAIVPTVSNSMAFFAGNFTKGPIQQPFVVTNKTELETYFGKPTDQNYNEWYQCYKFFDYANQLTISRAFTENIIIPTTITTNAGISTVAVEDAIYFNVGTILYDTADGNGTVYTITNISDPISGIVTITTDVPIVDGALIYVEVSHQNSGVNAYTPGSLVPVEVQNQSKYFFKNNEDFEFKKDTLAFDPDAKLHFSARTAGEIENGIEIAIGTFDDFATDSLAEAFPGISLVGLFQYAPIDATQYGIAIRQNDTIETFIVSFDNLAVDGNNNSTFIETVINSTSRMIFVTNNVAEIDSIDSHLYAGVDGIPVDPLLVSTYLTTFGGNSPMVDALGDIKVAYDEVLDKEFFEIDIVICNELDADAGITLADTRADCIAMMGARYEDTVGKRSAEAVDATITYILGAEFPLRSMFGAFFANYHKIYDNFAKKYRWINVAGDMAGLRADTNTANASWWASAGLRRGVIVNIDRLAFSPSLPQRDLLYKNSINPIVSFPGEGNLVWGQKTLLNYASSFDRVNVRGLFNTIERAMSKSARSSVFEFNDAFTRNAMLAMFNPYLSNVKAGRGVSDFLVICDTTNNTPDVISRNELVVDIYIKPMYAAEFIILNFNNVGTRSFASVIGA